MKRIVAILLHFLFILWMILGLFASRETDQLFELSKNLSLIYETPTLEENSNLWRMVEGYFDILKKIEVPAQVRHPEAIETIRVICTKGGPTHIDDVPYDDFAKIFQWNKENVTKYKKLIDDTQKLLDELVDIATEDRATYPSVETD